jgi:replicative DNA helicase
MSAAALMERMLCTNAHVSARSGQLNEREMQSLMVSSLKLGQSKLFIDDTSGLTILQLRARARRMAQKEGIKFLVVDYLQLIHASKKSDSREQEIAEVSAGIKELAKELNIPIMVLAQLNRESEKENRKPKMSDLRGSGSIEQDADFIGLLHRPKVEGDDESVVNHQAHPVDLFVAKQRSGPAGMDINFVFLKEFTQFQSCSPVEQEDIPRIGKNHASADI